MATEMAAKMAEADKSAALAIITFGILKKTKKTKKRFYVSVTRMRRRSS